MTALQLNAEVFRQLSLIADDESKMKRALKALKRIAEPKPDPTLMTREEFFARIDRASKGPLYELGPDESLDDLIKRAV